MKNKRVHYNWLFIIQDSGAYGFFLKWKKTKRSISDNRLARAFVLHYQATLNPWKRACYVKGHEMAYLEWLKLNPEAMSDQELF